MQADQELQEPQFVAIIPKGRNHELRVALTTHRGSTFADLRVWVHKDGNMIPTRKGCTVGVEHLEELEEAVIRLRNAAREFALLSRVAGWRPPA